MAPPRRSASRKRKATDEQGENGSAPVATSESPNSASGEAAETAEENKKVKADDSSSAAAAAGSTSTSSPPSAKLLLILSPAKTLDTSEKHTTIGQPVPWTSPTGDKAKINQLIRVMKQHAKDVSGLAQLLGISAKLAETAKEYWDRMELYAYGDDDEVATSPNSPGTKPAIFAFSGPAYQGLNADSLQADELLYLQQSLRIIDPVYGWLRPMDVVQPYRLEMATKDLWKQLQTAKSPAKLSEYWKPAIRDAIREEANHVVIVNVASDEYSAAVDVGSPSLSSSSSSSTSSSSAANITAAAAAATPNNHHPHHQHQSHHHHNQNKHAIHSTMIKVIFRHGGKVIAVHAKRARGLLVRYCALHRIDRVEQIPNFNLEGYRYQANESSMDTCLVFDRPVNWESAKHSE